MKKYFIDLETKSDVDISKAGAYRYADSPHFDILLFAYSVDASPVKVIDLASGEHIPMEIIKDIVSDDVQKHAFNAQFERVCLSAYICRNYPQYFKSYGAADDNVGNYLNPQSWRCTMVASAYLGLPLHLAGVGEVLNIEQKKMFEGKALIKYFCVPYEYIGDKPLFHKPSDAPDKWSVFKAYNKRDVEAEMDIDRKVSQFPMPDFVWEEYILDSEINDRGIRIDMTLARNAIALNEQVTEQLKAELKRLTGVDNPNSVLQVKEWLEAHGVFTEKLGKKEVAELLETEEEPVRTVLRLRQQIAKSSVKKYTAMVTAACSDDRARGMFQFYGANRTGREAGRIIQLQNLPQNHMPDLESARSLVRSGDTDAIEMLYDDIPDTLSQLIRTAFIPREGYKFIVADFGQIEVRTIAWLAGEKWRMEAFANGVDIYCASASKMFGIPVVKRGVNGHLRQKGKVAELACGYSGSVGAMKAMGADDMGLTDEELKAIVTDWRKASPNIVHLWYDLETAALDAIKLKCPRETHGIVFSYEKRVLFVKLPSGRRLAYMKPSLGKNRFGRECINYWGIGASKKWEMLETYSGKLTENVVQAIARDLLFYSMKTLSHCFIVGHIHDEMIIECKKDVSVEAICEQMSCTPPWAEGLLLRADGYECEFYKKD